MPHSAAQVLTVARRQALMADRMLMPVDLALMAVQTLMPADLALMVDQMPCFGPVPRVAQRLGSVEQGLKAGQTLAVVVDPSQKAARRRCFVADRELTVGQMLKLDQTLDALAVHFVRKAMAVLDHQQAGRTHFPGQVWMAARTPLLVLLAGQMYLSALLIVQKDLVWRLEPMVDQTLLLRAVQR